MIPACSVLKLSLLQDFGARDPTEGEIQSDFGAKSLGNADTWHVIRWASLKKLSMKPDAPVNPLARVGYIISWGSLSQLLWCSALRGPPGLEKLVGLANRKCKACEGGDVKTLDEKEAIVLRNQVRLYSAHVHVKALHCACIFSALDGAATMLHSQEQLYGCMQQHASLSARRRARSPIYPFGSYKALSWPEAFFT